MLGPAGRFASHERVVVSVSTVSALQTSLRSPSVLGRVADIFGDRNLYRAGFAVVALAFVGYNWFFVSLVGIDSSSQDTTLVTLLLSIVIIVELLAAVRQRGREALVRQNHAQLL